jgi:hypothetical protein
MSVIRAAGLFAIKTVIDPAAMASIGPTHMQKSPRRPAGMELMKTGIPPGGRIGPPVCGTGGMAGREQKADVHIHDARRGKHFYILR